MNKETGNTQWNATKMVAFRDKDIENDVWSERSFLFSNHNEAKKFFTKHNKILLDIYTEEEDRVLNDFIVHDGNPAGHITCVEFNTGYAGNVIFYEMSEGFVCYAL